MAKVIDVMKQLEELPFFTPLGWVILLSLMFWICFLSMYLYLWFCI